MLAGGWVSQLVIAPGIFGRQESKPGRAARTHTEPSRTQNSGFRGNIFGHPCGTRPSGEVQFVTKAGKGAMSLYKLSMARRFFTNEELV